MKVAEHLSDLRPQPGPQMVAAASEADELLYGGAAGGGKTFLLILLAITAHVRSIIFRRESTAATEIEDKLDDLVGHVASSNHNTKRWKLDDGRLISIGSLKHERDWAKYQGRPHDFIGYDELVQMTRTQFRMTMGWNRTVIPGQRVRVVATTNPPLGQQERWVVDEWAPWLDPKFPEPAEPGELRWYVYEDEDLRWLTSPEPVEVDGRMVHPKSRTFIPAKLEDNRYLLDTDYARQLDAFPESIRRALRDGDFQADADDDPWQVIPTKWIEMAMNRREGIDPGPVSHLGVDVARGGKDRMVVAERRRHVVSALHVIPGSEVPDGPMAARHVMRHVGEGEVIVDILGPGGSVYDIMASQDVPITAFDASGRSTATDAKTGKLTFVNKKAEAWWKLRERLDPQTGDGIELPDDRELLQELAAHTYTPTARGIQIVKKDVVKDRIGRSPDKADAVVMAFADSDSQVFWG